MRLLIPRFSHLVTIEVSVIGRKNQWCQRDRFTCDQYRLKHLYRLNIAPAIERIEQS